MSEEKVTAFTTPGGDRIFYGDVIMCKGRSYVILENKDASIPIAHPCGNNPETHDVLITSLSHSEITKA